MPSSPGAATTTIRVSVLGPLMVERAGAVLAVERWQGRARRLLLLLAASPERRRRREEAADLLWPEATAGAAASNVRHTLYLLRRYLGNDPTPVLSESGWLELNPDIEWRIDLERFEALSVGIGDERRVMGSHTPALLEEAASLYRGEPLPEVRYEGWAEPVRERLQRRWREICRALASAYLSDAPEIAARWAERLVAEDPLDEESMRLLLRAMIAAGHYREAWRIYDRFARRLRVEIGEDPATETQAIARRLEPRTQAAVRREPEHPPAPAPLVVVPSYPLPRPGPLVDREAEMQMLVGGWEPACGDEGSAGTAHPEDSSTSLVLVSGEAGMGKTRLLAEAVARAREHGVLTLAGAAYEGEGRLPYRAIHDALLDYVRALPHDELPGMLEDLFDDLALILPELRTLVRGFVVRAERTGGVPDQRSSPPAREQGGGEAGRLRLFAAIATLLRRAAGRQPVLLVLDDLHWGYEGAVQLVSYLIRQGHELGPGRLRIVAAFRPEEAGTDSELGALLRRVAGARPMADRARILELQPLPRQDLVDMVADELAGPIANELAVLLVDRSAGNAFFALEMARLLQAEGRLVRRDGAWQLREHAGDVLPGPVRELIGRRLRGLGSETREALALAAVLGPESSYAALAAMWTGTESGLFLALEEAVNVGVLRETETGYTFRHPLLRDTVCGQIPRARRPLLHGRAGLALETLSIRETEKHAAELAEHFWQARTVHEERALRYLELAGDVAGRAFAWEEAGTLYARAIELAQDDRAVASLSERAGATAVSRARYDEAFRHFERAAEIYSRCGDHEALAGVTARVGWAHYARGTPDDGVARVEAALRLLDGHEPSLARARLLGVLASLHWAPGRRQDASAAAARAAQEAGELSGPEAQSVLARAEMVRGSAADPVDGRDGGLSMLNRSISLAEACGDLDTQAQALNNLAVNLIVLGRFAAARATLERTLAVRRRLGDPTKVSHTLTYLGQLAFYMGEWEQARAELEHALSFERSLPPFRTTGFAPLCLGELLLSLGEIEAGTRLLEESIEHCELHHETGGVVLAHDILGEAELWNGQAERARARIEAMITRLAPDESDVVATFPDFPWALVETGDRERALKLIALARRALAGRPLPRSRILLTQGIVMSKLKRRDEAIVALREAQSLARSMPSPRLEGRALYLEAVVRAQRGEWQHARTCLQAARAIFLRLGAVPDLRRVEDALASSP